MQYSQQVKIISEQDLNKLESRINEWLTMNERSGDPHEIVDIKIVVDPSMPPIGGSGIYTAFYTAMIVHRK